MVTAGSIEDLDFNVDLEVVSEAEEHVKRAAALFTSRPMIRSACDGIREKIRPLVSRMRFERGKSYGEYTLFIRTKTFTEVDLVKKDLANTGLVLKDEQGDYYFRVGMFVRVSLNIQTDVID